MIMRIMMTLMQMMKNDDFKTCKSLKLLDVIIFDDDF